MIATFEQILEGDDNSLLHPPLYRLLSLGSIAAWPGEGFPPRWGWRLLSVLCGCAAILLAFAVGRRTRCAFTGLVAATLVAVHPELIYVSNLAKPYALDEPQLTLWVQLSTCQQEAG